MYPMDGVMSQPQAVTAGRPTHVNTGKLLSQATCDDTRVYTPAAAKVHSSTDHARAHSPVSSGSATSAAYAQHLCICHRHSTSAASTHGCCVVVCHSTIPSMPARSNGVITPTRAEGSLSVGCGRCCVNGTASEYQLVHQRL